VLGGRVEVDLARDVLAVVVVVQGGLAVLVDEPASSGVSSDRLAGLILDNFGVVRCRLPEAAMRSVRVISVDLLAQQLFELPVVPATTAGCSRYGAGARSG
jgi:hypothetical protein